MNRVRLPILLLALMLIMFSCSKDEIQKQKSDVTNQLTIPNSSQNTPISASVLAADIYFQKIILASKTLVTENIRIYKEAGVDFKTKSAKAGSISPDQLKNIKLLAEKSPALVAYQSNLLNLKYGLPQLFKLSKEDYAKTWKDAVALLKKRKSNEVSMEKNRLFSPTTSMNAFSDNEPRDECYERCLQDLYWVRDYVEALTISQWANWDAIINSDPPCLLARGIYICPPTGCSSCYTSEIEWSVQAYETAYTEWMTTVSQAGMEKSASQAWAHEQMQAGDASYESCKVNCNETYPDPIDPE